MVAVVVPSLIVMVLPLVTEKEDAEVRPETEPVTVAVVAALCCACCTIACALCTSLVIEVMPLLAACTVCTAFDTASSRLPRLLAVACTQDAVKKSIGLSSAEFTFRPVDRRCWVVPIRLAVFWSARRFARMPDERTMSDISVTFLVYKLLHRPLRIGCSRSEIGSN